MSGILSTVLVLAVQQGELSQSSQVEPELRFDVYAGVGTGLSMAGQGPTRTTGRSPAYLNVGASAVFSRLAWLTFDAGLAFEFEQRVGIGLVPRVRANLVTTPRWRVSAGVAVPMFVHSYSLLGVSAFARTSYHVSPRVSVYLEPTISGYIAGNDLVPGGGLMKVDATLGVNVPLPGLSHPRR